MAIRTDLTITWTSSPRIVTVDSPSTEISIQDLYDSLMYIESQSDAMDDDHIIDCAGKESLGGGTSVGLTATLLNALLAFEARSGPTYEQCAVSGGNLVAVQSDLSTYFTTPISPTAFTQVVTTASSSATSQNAAQLEYASFNGAITIDITSPYAGTAYPVGTPQQPVNNIDDAYLIAIERGFPAFYVLGDLNITSAVPDLEGFSFIGQGKNRTHIDIDTDAEVNDCEYFEAHIQGTLDGNSRLRDCLIDNLNYIKGFIEQCVISPGTIVLAGTEEAHFLDCWSGEPGTGTPTIDMGGAGQALALRNYNGGIKLTNKSGPEAVSIDLNSGQIKIGTDVTNGEIVVRGVGTLIDDSTGADVISTGLLSQESIDNIKYLVETLRPHHSGFGNIIYWDAANGADVNNGSSLSLAVQTFSRAHDLAVDGAHDVVVAVSSSAEQTIIDENIHITKNYLFLRGPGRDFRIKPTNTTAATIIIDAVGVEISGMVIDTADAGGQNAIEVLDGADFFHLDALWSRDAQNDAISVSGNVVYGRINNCFFSHPKSCGIRLNGNIRHTRIITTELDACDDDGIRLEGITCRNNIIGEGVKAYDCGGYGINILDPAKRNFIDDNAALYDNALGSVLDNGTLTVIESEETKDSIVSSVWTDDAALDIHAAEMNRRTRVNNIITIYEKDGVTTRKVFNTDDNTTFITPQ